MTMLHYLTNTLTYILSTESEKLSKSKTSHLRRKIVNEITKCIPPTKTDINQFTVLGDIQDI